MVSDGSLLTCRVMWSVGRRAVEHLTAGGRALGYLRPQTRGVEQRALVTVTTTGWSMDLEGDTVFGSDVTLVEDEGAITCLSRHGRERLSFGRDRVPSSGFERPVVARAEPRLEGTVLADGRPGVAIVVELEEMGTGARYRHRLVVDPQQPAGTLAMRLLDLLLGGATVHAASGYPFDAVAALVADHGTVVAGSVELIDTDDAPLGQVGGFRIEELQRSDGQPDLLAGSEDFEDLGGGGRAASVAAQMQAGQAPADLPSLPIRSAAHTATAGSDQEAPEPAGGPGGPPGGQAPPPPTPPQHRANGGRDPQEPSDTGPSGPSGPGTTTSAWFGLLLQQRLLTDISNNVNHLLGPLAGMSFSIAGGSPIAIDWLAAARSGVRASADPTTGEPAPGLGTLLFCLAHDLQPPANARGYTGPTITVPSWGTLAGRGLLDREAMREAKRRLTSGNLTPAMLARLTGSTSAAVAAAGTNWTKLQDKERLELAFAVLRETMGMIPPAGMPPLPRQLPFNADDLVEGELTGYSGTLTLPSAPTSDPSLCPLIASLACRTDGIDGSLRLGSLTVTGTLNRRAGSKYMLVLGLSVVVALAIPALAWIVPLLAGIEAFILLDSATATASVSGLGADFQVRFVADNSQVLKTKISTTISGTTSVSLASSVPTGLHQVVDLVIAAAVNSWSDELLNWANLAVGELLTTTVEDAFGRGFPAGLFRQGVPVVASLVSGQNNDHLYLEASLQAPSGTTVIPIPVPAAGRLLARQDAQRLTTLSPTRRHYLSLVSSQNSLNVLLAAAWARGDFIAALRPEPAPTTVSATKKGGIPLPTGQAVLGAQTLQALAPSPYPAGAPILAASLTATAPPRLTLSQAVPIGATQHGLLELPMALSLQPDKDRRYEWTIRFTSPAWVVIGSAAASANPKIELRTAYQQPIEILVDLTLTTAQVSAVHALEIKQRTVTETVNTNGTFDTWSHEETYEVDTLYALSGTAAQLHEPLVLLAIRQALAGRDRRRAPTRDGIRADGSLAGAADPVTVLRYQLDGTDPDGQDAGHPPAKAAFVLADLSFTGGLVFHHLSLAGDAAGILDPANRNLQTRDAAGLVLDVMGDPTLDPELD
jgi:hypothetical protein